MQRFESRSFLAVMPFPRGSLLLLRVRDGDKSWDLWEVLLDGEVFSRESQRLENTLDFLDCPLDESVVVRAYRQLNFWTTTSKKVDRHESKSAKVTLPVYWNHWNLTFTDSEKVFTLLDELLCFLL